MQELEVEMQTRVRQNKKDEDRMTGNMVWAEFVHFTARPAEENLVPDPHLHPIAMSSMPRMTRKRTNGKRVNLAQ
jgi:hypothetical protein